VIEALFWLLTRGSNTPAKLLAAIGELPMPDLGNITATAILGWYAWHTAAKTIPGLVADFRAELAARRAEYRADREIFRQEISEERMQRHADNLAIVQALHELTAELAARERSAPEKQPRILHR